jgi:hypothetical protein
VDNRLAYVLAIAAGTLAVALLANAIRKWRGAKI